MRRTRVQSLVGEDSPYWGAAKPSGHSYWARTYSLHKGAAPAAGESPCKEWGPGAAKNNTWIKNLKIRIKISCYCYLKPLLKLNLIWSITASEASDSLAGDDNGPLISRDGLPPLQPAPRPSVSGFPSRLTAAEPKEWISGFSAGATLLRVTATLER